MENGGVGKRQWGEPRWGEFRAHILGTVLQTFQVGRAETKTTKRSKNGQQSEDASVTRSADREKIATCRLMKTLPMDIGR